MYMHIYTYTSLMYTCVHKQYIAYDFLSCTILKLECSRIYYFLINMNIINLHWILGNCSFLELYVHIILCPCRLCTPITYGDIKII